MGSVEIDPSEFGGKINRTLLHDACLMYLANQRAGTASTLRRGEVAGSSKKLFKQKGTGNARAGTKRTNKRRGGGTSKGPKPRDYTYRPPKKVRAGALRAALSLRAKEKTLVIVSDFKLSEAKSKKTLEVLTKRLKLKNALLVDDKANTALHRSVRNLVSFDVIAPEGVNVESILRHKSLVLTSSAAKALEGKLS